MTNWSSRMFWVLASATGAVYAVMVALTLPRIAAAAGGRTPFDMRPMGYDFVEAQAFLAALSDPGRALYLGAQFRLDLLFPGLLAVTLIWAFWQLVGRGILWAGLSSLALIATGCDYLENIRVHAMLKLSVDEVTEPMVQAANYASVGKAGASTLAYAALLILLLRWGWQRWRG